MNILISVKMDIYIDDTMFGVYMFVDPSGRCWVDIDVQSKRISRKQKTS